MSELDKLAGGMAAVMVRLDLLTRRLEGLEQRVAYCIEMAKAIDAVEKLAEEIGVAPCCAWRPGPKRREIIRALRQRGWSLSRISKTLDMSVAGVRRA